MRHLLIVALGLWATMANALVFSENEDLLSSAPILSDEEIISWAKEDPDVDIENMRTGFAIRRLAKSNKLAAEKMAMTADMKVAGEYELRSLATFYAYNGAPARATQILRDTLSRQIKNPTHLGPQYRSIADEIRHELCYIEMYAGFTSEAISTCSYLLKKEPDWQHLRCGRAMAYLDKGDIVRARMDMRLANAGKHKSIGTCLLANGLLAEAEGKSPLIYFRSALAKFLEPHLIDYLKRRLAR